MRSLRHMTRAERAYMARRLPRTYRAMLRRADLATTQRPRSELLQERRRARFVGFGRSRHIEAKAARLLRIVARAPTNPAVLEYYDKLSTRIRRMLVDHTGFSWPELVSHRRATELVRARQAGMYLILKHTPLNLPQVGGLFGGRDHSTVIHARDKVAANPGSFADIIEHIEHQLGVR